MNPSNNELANALADSLEMFWNVALSATHPHQDASANAVMNGMVEGIQAVAERLREHIVRVPAEPEPVVHPHLLVPEALVIWANARDDSESSHYGMARLHVREMLKIRPPLPMGQTARVKPIHDAIEWLEKNRETWIGADKLLATLRSALS